MVSRKYTIILAMLVLAIFAVGSVSAADNVTADIDVPTEDIAVDDVSVEDVDENDNADDVDGTGDDYDVDNTYTSTQINSAISSAATTTHQVSFAPGTYSNVALTLVSNVNLIGNGAKLVGTGSSHVITLPNNLNNFTISGFEIDVNNATGKSSAIYGSFITNGVIANNTMYNGANGVNINKYYDNMTVENNIIYDMNNDGISFANPSTNSDIATLGKTYITNNTIYSCQWGIFAGGNFKGEIANNRISNCTYGMEFAGKPKANNGVLNATLFNNTISSCDIGINMFHPNVLYLYLDYMVFDDIWEYDIYTNSAFGTYTYIGVYNSNFDAGVTYAFYSAVGSNKGNNTNFVYYP